MHANDQRFREWLDLVGDLLRQPLAGLPRSTLTRELARTFQVQASRNWMNADGAAGLQSVGTVTRAPRETSTSHADERVRAPAYSRS